MAILLRASKRGGVDWIFHRLAFSEYTRAPVEFHLNRAIPYVLMDLAALDATADLLELDRKKAKRDRGE